jgi:lipoprotein-anchoring transpeptidase ErfK/SrfK
MTRRAVVRNVAVLALVGAGAIATPARAAQPLVVLLSDHVARTAPRTHAPKLVTVPARRPLTAVRTVLPRLARETSRDGRAWARVALPGRPNSGTGWIKLSRTRLTSTAWRLTVHLDARRLTVRHFGRAVRRFPAVVGAPATPTPAGRFFVEEALTLSATAAGGPFALATSARSNVLQEFEGGPGQIALHGRNYLSDPLGTAASHGCIRLSTRAITWLSLRIGAGVPLTIAR